MKAKFAALKKKLKEMNERNAAALSALGNLEELQVDQKAALALRRMALQAAEMEDLLRGCDEIETEAPAALEAHVGAELDKKLAAGELMTKAAVEVTVAAAKEAAKTEAQETFAAEKAALAKIGTRRSEIETLHGVNAAAALKEDHLAAEDFDTVVKPEFSRRVTELEGVGTTAATNKDAFAGLACAHPFTDEGKKSFDASIASVRLAAGLRPGQKVAHTAASTTPPGKGAAGAAAATRVPPVAGGATTEEAANAGGSGKRRYPSAF